MKQCTECGSEKLSCSLSTGEVICKNCGLVLDDTPFEENPFTPNKSLAKQPSMSTAGTFNHNGKIVKNTWLLSTREKNISQAKNEIELITSKHSIPERTKKEANNIFKTALEKNLTKGRDNTSMILASIYLACILHQIPKTTEELITNTEVTKTKLLKSYKLITTKLNIKAENINPTDLIPRYASRLELKQKTITKALQNAQQIIRSELLTGKQPKTIAATAIYLATKQTGDHRTQREITNATGVIEVTIRKRAREIKNHANYLNQF